MKKAAVFFSALWVVVILTVIAVQALSARAQDDAKQTETVQKIGDKLAEYVREHRSVPDTLDTLKTDTDTDTRSVTYTKTG